VNKPLKQSGTILVSTLLLLAVVTILIVGITERQYIDIKRTASVLAASQAEAFAEHAEIWATTLLSAPFSDQIWPKVMPSLALSEGAKGEVNAFLYDAEGQFYNLNNLSELSNRQGFYQLLMLLLPDQTPENNKLLLNAIVSWIQPLGQETDILSDQYYLAATPPYRAAHRFMASPSELRLVKGVEQNIYSALAPAMIALPETTRVNINTASALVLTSLGTGFSLEEANTIISKRAENGEFKRKEDFFAIPIAQQKGLSADDINLESRYFLLKTSVEYDSQTLTFFSLLKRTSSSPSTYKVERLWQMRETL
jgi:general secretion pathway protein K